MVSVEVKMRGIHGVLHYRRDSLTYQIPIENTGDYKAGLLVLLANISPPIPAEEKQEVLTKIRRDLQVWSKENQQSLCWQT